MNKNRRIGKRILAFFMAMVMVVSVWNVGYTLEVSAATLQNDGGIILTVDDPETLTRPIETFGESTFNAGKILVGKSVTDGINDENGTAEPLDLSDELYNMPAGTDGEWAPEKDNFLVTISQSAQMYGVSSKMPVPLDVVFVLDTSGSMSATDSGSSQNRAHDAVDAINDTIESLMALNEYNRVSVVAFSGHNSDWSNDGATTADNDAANVLSALGSYTGKAATNHLTWSSDILRGRTAAGGIGSTRHGYSGGTNIQAGIALGAQQLLNVTDTTVTIDGKEYTRMPFIILVSDGAPVVSSPENTWWDPDMINFGSGIKDIYGVFPGNSFLPVLAASYYKEAISDKYYPNGEDDATFYTIGLGLDGENKSTSELNESNLSRMTLNPSEEFVAGSLNGYYSIFKSYWDSYTSNQAFSVKVGEPITDGKYSHNGQYYFYPSKTTTGIRNDYQTFTQNAYGRNDAQTWVEVPNGTLMNDNILEEVTTLCYNDEFYDVEKSGDLYETFHKLIIEIQKRAIVDPTKVEETWGDEFSGYVTFTDIIGEYMEVKNLTGITGDGYLYQGKSFAKRAENYDPNWETNGTNAEQAEFNRSVEEAVATRMSQAGTTFSISQVRAMMQQVLAEGQIYYNSDSDYSNSFVWFGRVHYPTSGGVQEEDYQVEFIQLAPKGSDSVTWIADSANASTIAAAKADGANCIVRSYYIYGSADGVKTNATGEYLSMSIRTIRSLLEPYTQYMSVSAPASLLAVQDVLIDDTDPNNLEVHYTDLVPTRITYEVGLREDITPDNVLSVVNADYLSEYGNVNEDGTINFYTNDFVRYDDKADAEGSHDDNVVHDHALARVTFDVADENTFYRYENDTYLHDASGNLIKTTPVAGQKYYYIREYYTWDESQAINGVAPAQKTSAYVEIKIPDNAISSGHLKEDANGNWYITAGSYTSTTLSTHDDVLKTENKTVSAHIVSHPERTGDANNSHYTTWLGNNGRITFKPADPKEVYDYNVGTGAIGTASIDGNLVDVGDALYYQIQATNTHNQKAAIDITDAIPEGTKYVSSSIRDGVKDAEGNITWNVTPTGVYDSVNDTISWSFANVDPKTTVVVGFAVTVEQGAVLLGKVDNQAEIEIPEANNKYTTNITTNPVTGKSATDVGDNELTSVAVGDIIEYHIAYFNDQNTAAKITITDLVPEGTTYLEGLASHTPQVTTTAANRTKLTWEFENIQPGTGGVVSFQVQVDASIGDDDNVINQGIINTHETNIVTTPVEKGNLVLEKTVTGTIDATALAKEFALTLTESTGKLNGTFDVQNGNVSSVTFIDGIATIKIKHDQSITVKELPAGAVILVSETDPGAGFTPTVSNSGYAVISAGTAAEVDVTNAYATLPVSIELGGTKRFTNNGNYSETRTFFFELVETTSGSYAQNTDLVAEAVVSANSGATVSEAYSFAGITYTTPGTYTYKLVETDTDLVGVNYDNAEYTITVVVNDNASGQLVIDSVKYAKNGGAQADLTKNSDDTYGIDQLVFENRYTPLREELSLVGKKTLENAVLEDDQFSFVVKNGDATVATGQNKADGSIVFTTITYTQDDIDKSYVYTVEEVPSAVSSMQTDSTKYYIKVEITRDAVNEVLVKTVYTGTSATGPWTEVTDLTNLTTFSNSSTLAFANVYMPSDITVTLEGEKTLTGRDMLADEFDFIVTDAANNVVTSGSNKASDNGVAADIVFQPISYNLSDLGNDKTETFVYKVTEVNEGKDGITYDPASFEVKVTVSYNDSTGWSTSVTYPVGGVHFENTFTPDPVEVDLTVGTKTTTGNGLPAGLTFGYELIKIDSTYDDGIATGAIVATGTSGTTGSITLTEMSFVHEGTYRAWLVENNGGKTLHGVTYDSVRYVIEITVTRNDAGVLSANVKYFGSATKGSTDVSTYTNEITNPESGITFTNDYHAQGSLTIEADKKVTGRKLAANQYSFELSDGTTTHVATNDADGNVVFDTLNYTNADLDNDPFVYTMKELPGTLPGITYDKSEYKVKVTLKASGSVITPSYTITRVKDSNGNTITPETVTGWPVFNNVGTIYEGVSTTVELTKTLIGRDMKASEFSFVLVDKNGNVEDSTLVGAAADGTAADVSLDISISAAEGAGEYTFILSEVDNNLGGIVYDKSEYEVVVKVADENLDGKLEVVSKSIKKVKNASGAAVDEAVTTPAYVNNYKASEVEVVLHAQKILTNSDTQAEMTLTPDTFDFAIYEIVSGTKYLRETGSNTATGLVTFTPITLDTVGTYNYEVVEVNNGNVPGVDYDETVYYVTIVVTDDGEGNLVAEVTVDGREYNDTKVGADAQIQFNNTYDAEDTSVVLEATKVLTGRDMEAGEFTFYVYEGNNRVAIGTNKAAADGVAAAIDFSRIHYTAAGFHTYTVKEVTENGNGVLGDTEVFTVTVKVEEKNANLVATVTYPTGGIEFENTYEPAPIQVPIQTMKNLIGKQLSDGEFTFEIRKGSQVIATGTNEADGIVVFDYDLTAAGMQSEGITFEEAGTYSFNVVENDDVNNDGAKDNSNITYDNTVHTVDIIVTDDELGTLTANVSYRGKVPTFTNTYTPDPIYVPITAEKELIGRDLLDEEFTFLIETLQGEDVAKGTNAANGEITFDYDLTAAGIQSAGIKFEYAGTYRYAVSEQPDASKAGMTMDSSVWYVQIDIVQDPVTGALHMLHSAPHIVEVVGSTSDTTKGIVFTNTYDADSVDVTIPGVKGMQGHRTDVETGEFLFHVIDAAGEIAARGTTDASGKIVFDKLVFDKVGTYSYKVVEVPGTSNSIIYNVSEEVYSVVVVVSEKMENGEYTGKLEANVTIKNKAGEVEKAVTFINESLAPDLTIVKKQAENGAEPSVYDLSVEADDIVTYHITVTNTSEDAYAKDVVITDEIPAGLELVDGSISDGGSEASGTITWNLGTLNAGVSVTVTFQVKVPDVASNETWKNMAKVTHTVPTTDPSDDPNNTEKETIPSNEVVIQEGAPSLAIEKLQKANAGTFTDALQQVKPGDKVTYSITVTNTGSETAKNLTITDEIPAGLKYVDGSADKGGNEVNGTITWTMASLAAGASETVSFEVTVPMLDQDARWENMAAVVYENDPTDPDDPQESNKVVIEEDYVSPDLSIVKEQKVNDGNRVTTPLKVVEGDVVTYYITLKNNSELFDATDLVIADEIPEGLTLVAGSITSGGTDDENGVITWNIPVLQKGEDLTVEFQVTVPDVKEDTEWKNIATVTDDGNEDPSNEVVIEEGAPKLDILKEQSVNGGAFTTETQQVQPGNEVTYSITITNTGSESAENLTIKDEIPAGLAYVDGSVDNDGSVVDGTITWSVERLEAKASVTVSFKVTVPKVDKDTSWENVAAVVYENDPTDPEDPQESNEVVIEEEYVSPILTIEKKQALNDEAATADKLIVVEGDIVTYYITLTNTSEKFDAKDIVIADVIPAGLTLVEDSISNDGVVDENGVITWNIEVLENADAVTVSFQVVVPDVEEDTEWKNIASVSEDGKEPEESNEVEIEAIAPELTISKAQKINDGDVVKENRVVKAGDLITYAITVSNTAEGSRATNLIIKDVIPVGLELISDSITENGVETDGTIKWNVETLEGGESITVHFTVVVPDGFGEAEWRNIATVADNDVPEDSNEVVVEHGTPDLDIMKYQSVNNGTVTDQMQVVEAEDTVTYTIVVVNNGTEVAENLAIKDEIPAGLELVAGSITADGIEENGVITWNIYRLDVNEAVQVQFTVTVPEMAEDTEYVNVAAVAYENNEAGSDEPEESNEVIVSYEAPEVQEEPEAPVTGDHALPAVWTTFAFGSLAVCVVLLLNRKKEEA